MEKISREEAIKRAKLLKALMSIGEVSIILNTFFSAFLNKTVLKPDGIYYLHGNFNLGGTVSGRLSSCLPDGTMVQCKGGLVNITDITKDTQVLTHKGNWKAVKNVIDSGIAKVYKITLANGKTITCTGNHRLLTNQGFLSLDDIYGVNNYGNARRSTFCNGSIKSIYRWITKKFR